MAFRSRYRKNAYYARGGRIKKRFAIIPLLLVVLIPAILFAFIPREERIDKKKIIQMEIRRIEIPLEPATEQGERLVLSEIADLEEEVSGNDEASVIVKMDGEEVFASDTKDERPKSFINYSKYTVRSGDSLWSIAKKHGISLDSVAGVNKSKLRSASLLREGMVLDIPSREGIIYSVKSGDTLSQIAMKYSVSIGSICEANSLSGDNIRRGEKLFLPNASLLADERSRLFGINFLTPVSGRITSTYGLRKHPIRGKYIFHTGIDIGGNDGHKVVSAQDGKVIFAGVKGGYGNYVIISHNGGFITCYGHLRIISVKKGEWVKRGEMIGVVGNTGVSTGPHLHFEVKHGGKFVNPLGYVKY